MQWWAKNAEYLMSEALSLELTESESAPSTNISTELFTEGSRVIFQLRQVSHGYLCLAVVRNMRGISDLGELWIRHIRDISQRKKKSR